MDQMESRWLEFSLSKIKGNDNPEQKLETLKIIRNDARRFNLNNASKHLNELIRDEEFNIQKKVNLFNNEMDILTDNETHKKTKTEILSENLSQYGFFDLDKIKSLSKQSKDSLIEKISESGLPYAIAMFDYLQFIPFLEKQYFNTKHKLHIEVSKWFGSDKEGRAVKGNISSLLNYSTENKNRYTAYQHKESVKNDYEQLK